MRLLSVATQFYFSFSLTSWVLLGLAFDARSVVASAAQGNSYFSLSLWLGDAEQAKPEWQSFHNRPVKPIDGKLVAPSILIAALIRTQHGGYSEWDVGVSFYLDKQTHLSLPISDQGKVSPQRVMQDFLAQRMIYIDGDETADDVEWSVNLSRKRPHVYFLSFHNTLYKPEAYHLYACPDIDSQGSKVYLMLAYDQNECKICAKSNIEQCVRVRLKVSPIRGIASASLPQKWL